MAELNKGYTQTDIRNALKLKYFVKHALHLLECCLAFKRTKYDR